MYEPEKGVNFPRAVKELKHILQVERLNHPKLAAYRMMKFNGIIVTVSSDSNIDDLCVIYDLKRKLEKYE